MYKVVIIDDEPVIVEGLTRSIKWEEWGCEVVGSALNGVEGIALVKQMEPDILITDISMPKMDGLTMIASLKSQYETMEIMILTGYRDFDYAQRAIRLGVTRLLLKPSKMDELTEAIRAMTENLKRAEEMAIPYLEKEEGVEEKNEAGSFIVKNALAYIGEHYREKLTLTDVADQIYVSQWHLSKLLNKHTEHTFSELLNGVRIEAAKELLKDPALRIGDIADEVGFMDMAHFSRVFKKQIGISANEYRNAMPK